MLTPVDYSRINWIATANDIRMLPDPLKSRFRVIYVQEPRGEDFSRFFGNILEDIARDWGTDVEDLPRLDPALVKRLRDAFRKNPRSLRRLKSLTQDLLDWEARMQQASAAGPSWIQ